MSIYHLITVINKKIREAILKKFCCATLGMLLCSYSVTSMAYVNQSFHADPKEFKKCLARLTTTANHEGLSLHTQNKVIPSLKFVPRVIELDRKQPEFSQTFANYYNKRVTDWRVTKGRELLKEYRPFLNQLTHKYGIPPQYLIAFWGMETNFGRYKGKMPTLDSLATLACDDRRHAYFTQELMQALKLMEKYNFSQKEMVGSWAGAMGHTQFMPSAYVNYAVDGDGDGKADLWNSTEDALSSAAYFLQQLGWQRNERWGREVMLPHDFNYEYLGKHEARSLKQWAEMGILRADNLPLIPLDIKAALYLPSGHTGPAFLVYHNFDVMMRWNRSVFYGISVGRLADRIIGAGDLFISPPSNKAFSRQQIKLVQIKLNQLGFDVGLPDGILGNKSIAGLRQFQKKHGLIADGFPDEATIKKLQL